MLAHMRQQHAGASVLTCTLKAALLLWALLSCPAAQGLLPFVLALCTAQWCTVHCVSNGAALLRLFEPWLLGPPGWIRGETKRCSL